MRQCEICKVQFPDDLILPMIMSNEDGEAESKQACGICALRTRNEIHGLPLDTPFTGKNAHRLFERAVNFRVAEGWQPLRWAKIVLEKGRAPEFTRLSENGFAAAMSLDTPEDQAAADAILANILTRRKKEQKKKRRRRKR